MEEIAYIGDDINDLACIKVCALSACPSDASKEIKNIASYICKREGGNGAVREFIQELISRNRSGK